jgi:hypothetical protein
MRRSLENVSIAHSVPGVDCVGDLLEFHILTIPSAMMTVEIATRGLSFDYLFGERSEGQIPCKVQYVNIIQRFA